jgi:hypothetical protein
MQNARRIHAKNKATQKYELKIIFGVIRQPYLNQQG